MKNFEKDPNSKLDYSLNWALWLAGDTISSSAWIVPTGIKAGATSNDATSTTIWLEGGALGQIYMITNRIVTVAGKTEDRSFTVTIVHR